MPSQTGASMTGLPTPPPNWQASLASQFYRLKVAHEAAGLQNLQENRESVRRLVTLTQNRAFDLEPQTGLSSMEQSRGAIHVGDIFTQAPQLPATPAALPAQRGVSPLAKVAVGLAALGGALGVPIGTGLVVSELMNKPQPVAPAPDVDTIGVLEPDRG